MTETTFIELESQSVELRWGDPGFTYTDGLTVAPRAAIHISEGCPDQYFDIIHHCIYKGWIEPVAYMRLTEYVAAKLEQD